MRSHMPHNEALAAARADAEIHSHLDARHLISLLVRVIYSKSLDKTPWVKLSPSLPRLSLPVKFPLVDLICDDAVEIMAELYDSVTEEEEDEERDKRGRNTTSDSSSKSKPQRASSLPKKCAKSGNGKKSRPGQERKQTALARKSYGSLSDSEKWIVEVLRQGILSWCQHGVLMKFPPGMDNAITQLFGFSDYVPNLAKDEAVQALREHWDSVAFK
ncbi:hypothetical protein PHMEG_0004998 [Phytophthora megakarya]|uniref:Uncharacterized protein n=1 Tax=Phytophthora megakarya TaxID=4795 RepID=A0A225WUH2_9STRA|nr:hypothetical protein PHMEG_0004998 [Phytophthora megakarya]